MEPAFAESGVTTRRWKPGDECPAGGGFCDCQDLGICTPVQFGGDGSGDACAPEFSRTGGEPEVVLIGDAYRIVGEEIVREKSGATYKVLRPVSEKRYATRQEAERDV